MVSTALLAGVLLVGAACPAGACSCAPPASGSATAHADVVFVGVVAERVDPQADAATTNTGGPVFHRFRVDQLEKGELGSEAEVVSALSEASCGFRFHVGSRYRVYARHGPDGLTTGLCSGNERLGNQVRTAPVAPSWPPWGLLMW